ncbi:MAG: hypothetical protein ACIALR_15685 [Blastopirellula sp. JB062]
MTCGSGCGDEVYWGEWWSDPPTCDPCDCHGNWVGHNPGRICRPGLSGVRYGHAKCGCGSCGDACGASCGSDCGCHGQGGIVTHSAPHHAVPHETVIYHNSPTAATSRSISPATSIQYQGANRRTPRNLGRGTY